MKRRSPSVANPYDLIDQVIASQHELHITTSSRLHANILSFLRKLLGRHVEVSLSTSEASLYLYYPTVDEASRRELCDAYLKGGLQPEDEKVTRVLHSLCEPAAVVCARSLLMGEANATLMARLGAMSSVEQLHAVYAPLVEATLFAPPCEIVGGSADIWAASKRLYSSPYLSCEGAVATMGALEEFDNIRIEHILLGHAEFCVNRWIQNFFSATGALEKAAFPIYACNYLQDEGRYEMHALMLVAFRQGQRVFVVDPNGVVPESFGEPNAVFLKLPWKSN